MIVRSLRRRAASLLGSLALLSALAHGNEAVASGDDDPMVQCIAASNKGLDLRKQGKLLDARRVLAECAAPACGVDIGAVCRRRIGEINAVLPSMIFLPRDAAGKDILGVKMTIDDKGPPVILDGRPVVVDPGPHAFRFELAGQPPTTRSFIVAEGTKDRQEIIDIGPPPADTAHATGAETATAHGSGQKAAGLWIGGAGVLGVAAGAVFGILASSKWSASKSDCSAPATPVNCPRHQDAVNAHDAASTFGDISTVAFVAGGALLATGVVLELTAPRSSAATGVQLQLQPSVALGTVGFSMNGVFR
jgi:hypothetical protein